ncbi:MAG: glycoside hydrolase family 127 protein, partial [Candidatus Limnocylindrales bacterium]
VDVATELGDEQLLDAVRERWRDMVATRTYLTGGLGSRHRDESFGDPYELPPDGAYAETCAAIASVMLAWRLLLATGEAQYADLIERTIYNGVLPGVSSDGTRFFYENPLQRRTYRTAAEPGAGERTSWNACACCPPNLMRTLSSWSQYLATTDAGGIQIHQFASAELAAWIGDSQVRVAMATSYPWDGRLTLTVGESPETPWTLSVRIPAWCRAAAVVSDGVGRSLPAGDRWFRETRTWRPGDTIVVNLDMPARVTEPDPRIDSVRGCVALERGPLVYCLESADLPDGIALEELELAPKPEPSPVPRPDLGGEVVGLRVTARRRHLPEGEWPYQDADDAPAGDRDGSSASRAVGVDAIPYYGWANRASGAMRVWIPRGLNQP